MTAGRIDDAARASERLAQIAATAGDERLTAMVAMAAGRVLAARGDVDAAVAVSSNERSTHGRVWRCRSRPPGPSSTSPEPWRRPSRDLALGHARRALATFEQLGATLDADRAAALLRSMGVVARTGAKGVGVLTAREQDVYRLSAMACPTRRSPSGCTSAARRPPTT